MLSERPSRYRPTAAVHVFQQCRERTRPVVRRLFAFSHTNGSPSFLATCHQSDVGPLSRRVTLTPVSAPLQHGIRFFTWEGYICTRCHISRHEWIQQAEYGPCPVSFCQGSNNSELVEIAGTWGVTSCSSCNNTGEVVVGSRSVCKNCGAPGFE